MALRGIGPSGGRAAGARGRGTRTAAALAALTATAVLAAGCAGGGTDRAAARDDDKPATTVQPRPGPRTVVSPSPTPSQTSVADPALPPPVVSMDIAHAVQGGGRAVAITLDDGPDPEWTPRILKVLKENGVKATFCMIGPNAAAHPELVRQVVADGHRLCDHSVDHDESMDLKSHAYQQRQVLQAADQIEKASGGVAPQYYRAPGGAFTPFSRQIAAAHGLRPLGWNVDTTDWERPGVPAIERTVRNEIGNGPTILFHDGGGNRSQTVAALRQVLPWLKEHGYRFGFPVH